MIKKDNRFQGNRAITRVGGKVFRTKDLSFRYGQKNRHDYRLAVVVSKKISKKAVVRNRIRRRVFEVFRKHKLLDGRPIDVVVYVQNDSVAEIPNNQLETQIKKFTSYITR